jgi:hypothetical protein
MITKNCKILNRPYDIKRINVKFFLAVGSVTFISFIFCNLLEVQGSFLVLLSFVLSAFIFGIIRNRKRANFFEMLLIRFKNKKLREVRHVRGFKVFKA